MSFTVSTGALQSPIPLAASGSSGVIAAVYLYCCTRHSRSCRSSCHGEQSRFLTCRAVPCSNTRFKAITPSVASSKSRPERSRRLQRNKCSQNHVALAVRRLQMQRR
eukprot:6189009-Pleurochrysis_carterae.AAC.2